MLQIAGSVRSIGQHEMNVCSAIKEAFSAVADGIPLINQELSRARQQFSVLWMELAVDEEMW